MIIRLKEPTIGQKVSVYVNLHKQGLFSIVDKEPKSKSNTSGKVIAYAKSLQIVNAAFKVNMNSYQRILSKGSRNVCATVSGTFIAIDIDKPNHIHNKVTFKPFERSDFYQVESNQTVKEATFVHFEEKSAYI